LYFSKLCGKQVRERFGDTPANIGNIDQPLGTEYRNALKILETGVELSPLEPLPGWKGLFEALVTSSTIDAGDGGRAIAVIEPLARRFTIKFSKDSPPSMLGLGYCRMLVSKATYPKDRQVLDAAHRKMWGAASNLQRGSYDPYVQLYDYLRGCLENAYSSFAKDRPLECADLITATTALLNRCSNSNFGVLLEKLQTGIGRWILDEKSKLVGGNALSQAVRSPSSCVELWLIIIGYIPLGKGLFPAATDKASQRSHQDFE